MQDNADQKAQKYIAYLAFFIGLIALIINAYTYHINTITSGWVGKNQYDISLIESDIFYDNIMSDIDKSYIVSYLIAEDKGEVVEKQQCIPATQKQAKDKEWLMLLMHKIEEKQVATKTKDTDKAVSIALSKEPCEELTPTWLKNGV